MHVGRDVKTWSKKIFGQVATSSNRQSKCTFDCCSTLDHAKTALDEILHSQLNPQTKQPVIKLPSNFESASASTCLPRVKMSTSNKIRREDASVVDEDTTPEPNDEESSNLFEGITITSKLLDIIDRNVDTLANLKLIKAGTEPFSKMVQELVYGTSMSVKEATEQLLKWQKAQKNLEDQIRQVKIRKRNRGQEAIWRCAVCGRANEPYIACWVAPYIVGYRAVER